MKSLETCAEHEEVIVVYQEDRYSDRLRKGCPLCAAIKEKAELEEKLTTTEEERNDLKEKLDEAQQDLKDS
jgi:hypothetical protein